MKRKQYMLADRYHRALSKAKVDLEESSIGHVVERVLDGDKEAIRVVSGYLKEKK